MQRRARANAPPKIYPSAVVLPGASLASDTVVAAFCFIAAGAVLRRGTRVR